MNLPAAVFGLFCVFVLGAGIFYVVGTAHNQPTYTDTYGNTYSAQTNNTMSQSGNVTNTGGASIGPLILIVAVVLVFMVLFLIYLAAKAWFL